MGLSRLIGGPPRHHRAFVVACEVDELEDQAVHRRLELQRERVEAEGDAVFVVDDAVDGHAAGLRRELAIEQDHQPSDAVLMLVANLLRTAQRTNGRAT
jgi:hypothetical protein